MTQAQGDAAHSVKLQVAQHLVNSVNGLTVDSDYLAAVIKEITPETTITGASLLHLYVIDPYWIVQRSGLIDTDESGELANDVDVNFPEGSGLWWRLAMVDGGNDLADANLELTFIDRAVAYMQDDWGPLAVAPGTRTRAQFIKQLVDRIPRVLHVPALSFVCPEINEIQPVASSTTSGSTTTVTPHAAASSARTNKTKGIGAGTALTVKGQPMNATQRSTATGILSVGEALGTSPLALEASMFDAMFESDLGTNLGPNNSGYGGVLGGATTVFGDVRSSLTAMATSFFQGGNGFQAGGATAVAQRSTDVAYIGSQVTAAVPFNAQGYSTQYLSQGFSFTSAVAEAKAIVQAYGITSLSPGISTGGSGTSDVSQLARGTSENADEDSWTCSQRLAAQVNWPLFSNGDSIFFMDGPTLAAQQPSLYMRLSPDGTGWTATDGVTGKHKAESSASRIITNLKYTFDNTSFQYQSTHKRRGRIQRKTAIRKPQTASQVRLNMVCGVFEFRAGDVFVFQDAGALNGRWIVEDTTRNVCADQFTQFTLGPPTIPLPEPAATTTSAASSPTGPGTSGPGGSATAADLAKQQGTLQGVATAALLAFQQQNAAETAAIDVRWPYRYLEQRPFPTNDLFGPTPRIMDCSQFATLCYKAAGLPDPNHLGYDGYGNTNTLIGSCRQIAPGSAKPGDLCFFGSTVGSTQTTHVNVYVGNGQSVSMGKQGDPAQGPAASMGPSGFLGYFRSDVAPATFNGRPVTPPGTNQVLQGVAQAEGASGSAVVQGLDHWIFGS